MFSKKSIVVTIGNYGSIVAFHNANVLTNKLFVKELNDTSIAELKNIFSKEGKASITILLDTIDQSYRKKTYPNLRKGDLSRIIRRDMATDGDKESLKNYIILGRQQATKFDSKKSNQGWDCLFISSSLSELSNSWLTFIDTLPNRLIGIYMLPIESFALLKKIKNNFKSNFKDRRDTTKDKTKNKAKNKSKSKVKKNNNNKLYFMIMQNKVSGVRQVVFNQKGIVFTRIVSYDFKTEEFLEKYEQDIYSTFEYLKRLYPNITIQEIEIINIFPKEATEAIENIENHELKITNYTPYSAAAAIGLKKLVKENSKTCDLVISKAFSKGNKILKFLNPKIAALERFFTILKSAHYLNFILIAAVLIASSIAIFDHNTAKNKIKDAKNNKVKANKQLEKLKKDALEGVKTIKGAKETINIKRVVDIGKIELILQPKEINISETYKELNFLTMFDVKLNKFDYYLNSFNKKAPSKKTMSKINFRGKISNSSGDIEDLFTKFDNLNLEVKKNFNQHRVISSEIPRNIDFEQEYYDFPIDFTISKVR